MKRSFVVLCSSFVVACADPPPNIDVGEGEGDATEGEGDTAEGEGDAGEGEGEGPLAFRTINASGPKDLTPDGATALIENLGFGEVLRVDTLTGAIDLATTLPRVERDQTGGISQGGDIVADYDFPVQAGLFRDGAWQVLGSIYAAGCGTGADLSDVAGAFDISADGNVVVGLVWDNCTPTAFRWDDDDTGGTMTGLDVLGQVGVGSPALHPTNRATVISDDGNIAAGFAENVVDRAPAIWNRDGSGFLLAPDDTETPGEVLAINADGSVVAGVSNNEGFVWNAVDGMQPLGRLDGCLPGLDNVFANAVTADGSVVFGACGFNAFVWTEASGMRSVQTLLAGIGVDPSPLILTNVLAVSDDGSVVLASSSDDTGAFRSAIIRVDPALWQ